MLSRDARRGHGTQVFPTALRTAPLLLAIAVSGCKGQPSPGASTETQAAKLSSTPAPSSLSGAAAGGEPGPPRIMEFTNAEASSIGTLPVDVGVEVGTQAPELTGTDSAGGTVSLTKLVAEHRVLLIFYRGGWCPYCNFQVRELAKSYDDFKKLGIEPVLVSVDKVGEAAKTDAAYEIPFPVVSDSDLVWHKAFRVLNEMSAEQATAMKKFGIDVEASSGRKHHTVAIPSMFLIEKGGTISFAHAQPDYKTRPRVASLLAALKKLPAAG